MAGGTRIRIGRANQRHYEPEKLPGPNRVRARAIHARFEELSEESALDRGVMMRYITAQARGQSYDVRLVSRALLRRQ